MKITADTNVLVRALTGDDEAQASTARKMLAKAQSVAVTLPALCELVWVLSASYRIPPAEIATALRRLVASESVAVNRPAVEAGLRMLEAGGDFADGVIAHEGRMLGAEVFVSFDKRAVRLLMAAGERAELLG